MEETFKEPCEAYYKIFVSDKDLGYKYRSISPFEFKNTLIKLAQKKAGKGDILNAGRGNPNFYSSVPRYAFGLLQIFSTYFGTLGSKYKNLGFIPEEKGDVEKIISTSRIKQYNKSRKVFTKSYVTYEIHHRIFR